MGELHLEIIIDRMKEEYDVHANVGKPQVSYRETIRKTVEHMHFLNKQTGGKGQYAKVEIRIEPNGDDGFEFVDAIKGGVIPREYIPGVDKGCRDALTAGPVAGYPVLNVKATLFDGHQHDVDSSEMTFRIAGRACMKEALAMARPVLLEPIMNVEVITPDEHMGDVIGDLSRRRGILKGSDLTVAGRIINADVPLREMFGYATDLRSATQGRATFTMEFSKYAEAPASITEEIAGKA
jgi:elongation factor G